MNRVTAIRSCRKPDFEHFRARIDGTQFVRTSPGPTPSSLPLLTRGGVNVEFDRQLIFDLDASAGDAYRSDAEIALP